MSQAEVRKQQAHVLGHVLEMIVLLVIGARIGAEGIAYFAVALEGYLFCVLLLAEEVPDILGKVLRRRKAGASSRALRRARGDILLIQILLGAAFGGLLFVLAPVLCEQVFLIPYGTLAMRILAPAVCLRVVGAVLMGYCEGKGAVLPGVLVSILRPLGIFGLSFPLIRLFAAYGEKVSPLLLNDAMPAMYSAAGVAVAVTITELVLFLLEILFTAVAGRQGRGGSSAGVEPMHVVGEFYGEMGGSSLLTLLSRLPLWLGMALFMRAQEDSGTAILELGVFYVGYLTVCWVLFLLCDMLLMPFSGRVLSCIRRQEERYARDMTGFASHGGMVLAAPVVALVIGLAEPIGELVCAENAVALSGFLRQGAILVLFLVLARLALRILVYEKKSAGAKCLAVCDLVAFLVFWAGAGSLGIRAFLYGGVAAGGVLCVLSCALLFKKQRVRTNWIAWLVMPLAGAVPVWGIGVLCGSFVADGLGNVAAILIAIALGMAVYWVILLAMRSFREVELGLYPGGKRLLIPLMRKIGIR